MVVILNKKSTTGVGSGRGVVSDTTRGLHTVAWIVEGGWHGETRGLCQSSEHTKEGTKDVGKGKGVQISSKATAKATASDLGSNYQRKHHGRREGQMRQGIGKETNSGVTG